MSALHLSPTGRGRLRSRRVRGLGRVEAHENTPLTPTLSPSGRGGLPLHFSTLERRALPLSASGRGGFSLHRARPSRGEEAHG
ncbi:MAG: hypothetical protein B7Y65_02200 [Azorhizobium sp. 35-67-15]|nr:MAG: hypothetical protein B7Y65_02200 [Azorhizobium sp. 35-67-15]OZA89770.1 MAG: hypothetical protein B7X76_04245 [Azorhizobium sp. 39-67-5]